ncbi:hypothetical protein KNE206_27310 [Kitasatospora sp. NE20-6]
MPAGLELGGERVGLGPAETVGDLEAVAVVVLAHHPVAVHGATVTGPARWGTGRTRAFDGRRGLLPGGTPAVNAR